MDINDNTATIDNNRVLCESDCFDGNCCLFNTRQKKLDGEYFIIQNYKLSLPESIQRDILRYEKRIMEF